MKYLTTSWMLLYFIILISCKSKSDPNAAPHDPIDSLKNYFYTNGEKIFFEIEQDKLPIKLLSNTALKNFSVTRQNELIVDSGYKFSNNILVFRKPEGVTYWTLPDSINKKYVSPSSEEQLGELILTESNASMILTNQLVAKFKETLPTATIDSLIKAMSCNLVKDDIYGINRFVFECEKEKVLPLANMLVEKGFVEYAHPDFISEIELRSYPDDPMFSAQWHLDNIGQGSGKMEADIRALEAWAITKGNSEVVIAFVDDAFDVSHEDLVENLILQKDFTADPDDDSARPDFGEKHGTSVLGVGVAKGNNGIGICGSCPDCKFIAIRALDGRGSNVAEAILYASKAGAWIISNSWGYPMNHPIISDLSAAIKTAATEGRNGLGCVVLFAMTNEKDDNCYGRYKDISSDEYVIAVSRSTNMDEYGKAGFGTCMEILAPTAGGTLGILTTDITGIQGYTTNNYNPNFNGTSSSTPLVAGVVGLMLSVNNQLTRDEVRSILINSTDKIDALQAKYDQNGFSNTHGYGRVNAYKAVSNSQRHNNF